MINYKDYIKDIKDYPIKGITFKDICPLLANPEAYNEVIKDMSAVVGEADVIVSPDARGFLFGVPVALRNNIPFVMVRKPNKLPGETISEEYSLEYGTNKLEMQVDSLKPGQKVVIIDDVLATGGTTEAIVKLVEKQGAIVVNVIFLLNLSFLKGEAKYNKPTVSLIDIKNPA